MNGAINVAHIGEKGERGGMKGRGGGTKVILM